ncbi:Zn-dependent hydrolase, glyoxylase [Methylophilaceae bacterium 11]|uniref:MBL fold metallo-hydrolase n=1 Tax=Methylotenera sp. N17 TaxID=1502761 RepID=UPI00044B4AD9|nr:MBL fold metallo-hydrolase [Methylotenera sp. N17]EUJ10936.1 Zn-dependent hydrolase, glyoxylase [Methylophilaceae bacterium 11]
MFKQLLDRESSTFTYLIVDDQTKEAALIDPVDCQMEVYVALLEELSVTLKYALETHVHADHVTASGKLRQRFGIQTAVSQQCGATSADLQLNDGDVLKLGQQSVKVIATPGHTPGSVSYVWQDKVFTGDALLINGCGRTDFQGGDAGTLYDSITQRLFILPDETLVYPAHDYQGRWVSCIAQEKAINPRLSGKTREAFIALMQQLNLPKPKMIDIAVPANRKCGVDEDTLLQG